MSLFLELLYYYIGLELNITSGDLDALRNILNGLSLTIDNISKITEADMTTGEIILDHLREQYIYIVLFLSSCLCDLSSYTVMYTMKTQKVITFFQGLFLKTYYYCIFLIMLDLFFNHKVKK